MLLDIARHPTIASQIEIVRLSRSLLEFSRWQAERDRQTRIVKRTKSESSFANIELDARMQTGELAFVSYWLPQRDFIKKGIAKDMLSEIISLLPNLRIVALGEWEVAAEDVYNDRVNYFDKDICNHILTHGYPKNEAQEFEDAYSPHDEGFREVNVILRALADSRKSIEGFFIRSYSLYENGIHLQRVVRLNPPLKEGLSEVFKRLRTLHLSLAENSEYLSQLEEADEEPIDDDDQGELWLAHCIALTPLVEDLTLSFQDCDQNGSLIFAEFAKRAHLPKLTKLGLHFSLMNPQDLKRFLIKQSPVLQDITLRYCSFKKHRWSEFLSDTFLGLDWKPTITIARLAEGDGNHEHQQSSVLFDTDHLLDCCHLGSDSWSSIRGLDCEHVSRILKPKDLLNLQISIVDQTDPKYKEHEEEQNRKFDEEMQKEVAEGRMSEARLEHIRRRIGMAGDADSDEGDWEGDSDDSAIWETDSEHDSQGGEEEDDEDDESSETGE